MFYQNNLKKVRFFLLVVCFVCPFSWSLKDDANQPIHIEGDDAEIDQANETIVFTGAVEVVQGSLRVFGERIVVNINGDQVERITTLGSPAQYKQQLEDNQGEVEAHADAIIYHTSEERIYLRGHAALKQKGNKLSGESIRYDIVNGGVDASAGEKKGRVKMELDPATARTKSKPADSNNR